MVNVFKIVPGIPRGIKTLSNWSTQDHYESVVSVIKIYANVDDSRKCQWINSNNDISYYIPIGTC